MKRKRKGLKRYVRPQPLLITRFSNQSFISSPPIVVFLDGLHNDILLQIDPSQILPSRARNRAKVDYTSEEAYKKAGLSKDDEPMDD